MHPKYRVWIDEYIAYGDSVVGRCHEVCEEMMQAFPELILRGGYAHRSLGDDIHYWLLDPAGEIVDPTESQYGRLNTEDYEDAGTTDACALLSRFLYTEPRIYGQRNEA